MKKSSYSRIALFLPALVLMMGMAAACNSDSDTDTGDVAVTSSTVAVSSFYLKADTKVMKDLDSVFFSIDLNKGMIFNADSLPKGTNISKLLPAITFSSTMSAANIAVLAENGDTIQKVDYLKSTNDSIDFSKTVRLKVVSYDKKNTLEYDIKVNVHNVNPDSIGWTNFGVAETPSRLGSPVAQKTVLKAETPYSIIKENDGTYSIATASDIFTNTWNVEEISLPFTPEIDSFTASPAGFFILSDSGELYASADAADWSLKASGWESIIGAYGGETLLGIKNDGGRLLHVSLTGDTETTGLDMPGNFPVSGRTTIVTVDNKWATIPTVFFCGGVSRDGVPSSITWAFDGNRWAALSNTLPPLEGASLVKYVMFRKSPTTSVIKDFDAWIVLGGRLADGTLNRTLYLSFDNGVSWKAASSAMELPEEFPDVAGQDAFTLSKSLSADLSDYWTSVGTRADYVIEGTDVIWDCPYIFINGGYLPGGTLSPEIWKGVLMRLNFTPLI